MAERLEGEAEIVPIRTSGDERRGGAAQAGGDKARFVKEIEDALLAGEVDLGVHSAKDVPSELPEGLAIVGVPERADPRDALCGASAISELPDGTRVGTSSLRRRAQLTALRPELEVSDLRGNVDTRLRRLEEGDFDALLLAAAGLERLGRSDEGAPVPSGEMTPAAGQGTLALEARSDDAETARAAGALTDDDALARLAAERALVAELQATCRTPVGAHAAMEDGELVVDAFVGLPDGSIWVRDRLAGDPDRPSSLGEEVGRRLLGAGAHDVLEQAERLAE